MFSKILKSFLFCMFILSISACFSSGPKDSGEGVFGNKPVRQAIPENLREKYRDKIGKTYYEIDPTYQCRSSDGNSTATSYRGTVSFTKDYMVEQTGDLCGSSPDMMDLERVETPLDKSDLLGYKAGTFEPRAPITLSNVVEESKKYNEVWCRLNTTESTDPVTELRIRRNADGTYSPSMVQGLEGKLVEQAGFYDAGVPVHVSDNGSFRRYDFKLTMCILFGCSTEGFSLKMDFDKVQADGRLLGVFGQSSEIENLVIGDPEQPQFSCRAVRGDITNAEGADAASLSKVCTPGQNCNFITSENITEGLRCTSGTIRMQAAKYFWGSNIFSCADYMRTTCNGNKQCAFALNNEHCGGDPKPGRGKTGILAYTCDTPESKGLDSKPVCTLGESCSFTTFENLGEVIRCESGVLSVQGVKYGFGLATSECSNYLKSYCNGWTNCNVTLSNANCGGDPAYGRVKSGEITYSCVPPGSVSRSQSEATGTQICTASTCSQTATEGVSSRMVCDTGLISIKAASYGVDSVTRDCSAGLRTSCEGQKDCSYMVSNLACGGDPVPNVVKQGQVSYTCQ